MSATGGASLGCGLFERGTAVRESKGHMKEHGWVLVSKSLTLPPAPPWAGKSFDDLPSEKKTYSDSKYTTLSQTDGRANRHRSLTNKVLFRYRVLKKHNLYYDNYK